MGTTYTPGQVLACDDGAFCEPHLESLSGFTLAGPSTIPITQVIDGQTKSLRPSKKEVVANETISRWVESGDVTIVDIDLRCPCQSLALICDWAAQCPPRSVVQRTYRFLFQGDGFLRLALTIAAVQRQGRWKHGDMVARYTRGESAGEALKWLT